MKKLLLVFCAATMLLSCSKKTEETGLGEPTPSVTAITSFSPRSASTNNVVTITGNNFGNDRTLVTVKFGNSAAVQPQTVEPSKITAVVPGDATTGRVTVIISNVSYYSSETLTITPTGVAN